MSIIIIGCFKSVKLGIGANVSQGDPHLFIDVWCRK